MDRLLLMVSRRLLKHSMVRAVQYQIKVVRILHFRLIGVLLIATVHLQLHALDNLGHMSLMSGKSASMGSHVAKDGFVWYLRITLLGEC